MKTNKNGREDKLFTKKKKSILKIMKMKKKEQFKLLEILSVMLINLFSGSQKENKEFFH